MLVPDQETKLVLISQLSQNELITRSSSQKKALVYRTVSCYTSNYDEIYRSVWMYLEKIAIQISKEYNVKKISGNNKTYPHSRSSPHSSEFEFFKILFFRDFFTISSLRLVWITRENRSFDKCIFVWKISKNSEVCYSLLSSF